MQKLAHAIACEMGLPDERKRSLLLGSIVHDIGKIYIATEILNKPGRLTELERKLLCTHCQYGYEIVREIGLPWQVHRMILQHHKRLDGSGYPNGVAGEEIILESRILAVADVVDAMSSNRPYRPSLGLDAALQEISAQRGIKYDADVVNACLTLFQKGKDG